MERHANTNLLEILSAHKRGSGQGVFSVCSAHPFVLETTVKQAAQQGFTLLIESTCNQVNQFGGYTGMTPAHFSDFMMRLSNKYAFEKHHMVLGGDHLGPYPWRHEPAAAAMDNALQMIADYVSAGYTKIHLDASMRCADDDARQPLDTSIAAERSAILCQEAERVFLRTGKRAGAPLYVIGSEVPAPGGAQGMEESSPVTSAAQVEETILLTREAFLRRGLHAAWDRVIAIVSQPGVEFGDQTVQAYDRRKAAQLSRNIEAHERLVYEAHSTDYQTIQSLQELVRDHFAILKVGPELTFAYREAIFALEQIEQQISMCRPFAELSNVSKELDAVMREDPTYWEAYYLGSEAEKSFARKFGLSDRIRYYWSRPSVENAVRRLFENLDSTQIPFPLVSQYLPVQHRKMQTGQLDPSPRAWVEDRVCQVIHKYAQAVGYI